MSHKEESQQKKANQNKQNRSQLNTYVRYSGLAFQMIAAIGLAVWGGMKLDDAVGNNFPAFMIILSLLAFAATLVVTIRSLPKD